MATQLQHNWQLTPAEAIQVQQTLRHQVVLQFPGQVEAVRRIAGADISFNRYEPVLYAAVVILSFPELQVLQSFTHVAEVNFPYIPGLLSFREVPALLPILEPHVEAFDVLICDGQGIAHPRRFGLAAHLGVLLNKPTIGCAKSRLTGHYREPNPQKGSFSPLLDDDEPIGAVVRTRTGVKPVFVSPGHLMDIPTSVQLVLATTRRYRLPEPTRQAHILVNQLRQNHRG